MKLKSFISQGWELIPIEVEVLLVRGLPELKFIGLPDQAIRESAIRIKTSIKQSGFRWPEADQVVVNLKPSHLKKTSRGLELAVAAGILWETEQLERPSQHHLLSLYGELNLDGTVQQPEDLIGLKEAHEIFLLTGALENHCQSPWLETPIGRISNLQELSQPHWSQESPAPQWQCPDFSSVWLSPLQAELIKVAAWGRHSLLMAGPAGSGKSFITELIHGLGATPIGSVEKDLWRNQQLQPNPSTLNPYWRPLVRPHHSITTQGLIGGGNPIQPGEIQRAHHGTLILDELLEFKPTVIESLREPLETNKIRLARVSGFQTYDCNFHLIATTNLCPCGDFVPKVPTRCRYSLTRCRSYAQKLSGPLIDRFQILTFSHRWQQERSVSWNQLREELDELRNLTIARNLSNSNLPESFFNISSWPLLERKILEQVKGSQRRFLSTLRVSQTIAELNQRTRPNAEDIEKSIFYTVTPFVELQRWD